MTTRYIILIFVLMLLTSLLLTACGTFIPTATPTFTPAPTRTPAPTKTPTPTPTPTPLPPLAVLLAAQEADQAQVNRMQTALHDLINNAGMRWQVRQRLNAEDLTPELRLVVVLPPDPGIASLAAAAPGTQFLSVGIQGIESTSNLSAIGAQGPRPDQQGFIAGVMAAMLTPDWRVGVISISDTPEGKAARNSFLNGVVYFCGLCNPAYAPFYDYPLFVDLPSSATTIEWQAAAGYLTDRFVHSVYVAPGAGDEAMLNFLAEAGVDIIGYGTPSENLRPHWVASLNPDILPQVLDLIPQLLQGEGGQDLPLPLVLSEINPELLSPGKQMLTNKTLADLLAGYIDTGVDLASGEFK